MNAKHACFISYRNGDRNDKGMDARRKDIQDTLNAFACDLRDELKRELVNHLNLQDCMIFFDQDENCLSKGDPLMSTFSSGVCNSVCMIVVFTRHYLDKEKLTCAAELEGMMRRLEQRCEKMGLNANIASNWIFTAVFREPERVPDILNKNLRFDFTAYENSSLPLRDNPEFRKQIKVMAKKIADFWEELYDQVVSNTDNLASAGFQLLDPTKHRTELQSFVAQHRKPFDQQAARS